MTSPVAQHSRSHARTASGRTPNRVQRFAVVGIVATLVDVAVLVPLIRRWGFDAFTADLVSVSIATVVSLLLHRLVTLANSPTRRWFENHAGSYLTTLVGSLAVDVVVFTAFTQALDARSVHGLVISKAVAVCLRLPTTTSQPASVSSSIGNT